MPVIFSRRSLITAALAAATFLLAACGDGGTTTAPAGGGGPANTGKKLKLAFVSNNTDTFWTIAKAGVNKALTEVKDVEVEFQMPAGGSIDKQKQILEDLVSKKVDGIAISPISPASQTEMLNEIAGKAFLITQDSDAPNSKREAYIGTDNKAAGRQAGALLKRALPNGGKVKVFVGRMDAQNAQDRFAGLKEAIAGTKIEILGEPRTDDTKEDRAKENVADTLTSTPDIAGLVGLWSYNGPAILNAVKDAGKIGKVKIVCFDEKPDVLNGIRAGEIEGTVVQQPFEFGRQSILVMAKALRGDKSGIPANKQIIVETQAIDKANVAEFTAKLESYLK